MITLEPDLASCAQTVAKREYEHIMRELLRTGKENKELHESLETLKLFLESTDFGKLRSEYEKYLLEGKRVRLYLRKVEGHIEHTLDISQPIERGADGSGLHQE